MNFLLFVLIFPVQQSWCRANMKQVYCNVTGSVMINPVCKLRPITRVAESLSLGFETTKQLSELYVSTEISSKMSTYWNRIIRVPPVDLCKILKMSAKSTALPIVQDAFREYAEVFPSFPQKCPILPGKFNAFNRTVTMFGFINLPNNPLMDKFIFPNGRYRVDFWVSPDSDPEGNTGFRWGYIMDVRNRLGDDNI